MPTKRKKKPEREIIVETEGRKVTSCNRCEKLCASRTNICNGFGPRGARIAYIGEGPGGEEDIRRRPFIGPAGQTLRMWLRRLHVNIERDVYMDNAVRCRPEENRNPTVKEIGNCHDFLMTALADIEPSVIVAAGNWAARTLLGTELADQGIMKLRGHVFWHEELGCKVVPMVHPSAVFHDFNNEPTCLFDLRKAIDEADHPARMPPGLGDYEVCLTVREVEETCARLEQSAYLVYDLETDGLDWRKKRILCIALTDQVGRAWVVPFVGKMYRDLWTPAEWQRVSAALTRLLESDVPKIAQNGKFDNHFLREQAGIEVNNFAFDTMLAYHVLNEVGPHNLESMRSRFTTMPYYDEEVIGQTEDKKHMERADEGAVWKYAGADVDCTLRVAKKLDVLLEEESEHARFVFEEIAMPLQETTMRMEQRGVLIDAELADWVVGETERLIVEAEKDFYSHVPPNYGVVNYGSPQQLQILLYKKLRLPMPPVLTPKGARCGHCKKGKKLHLEHVSTGKDALAELEGAHPIIEPLGRLRTLTKLRGAFLLGQEGKQTGLLQAIADDGRIHTTYRVPGTVTGRLSSSPNLQNVPKAMADRPDIFTHIRRLFTVPDGHVFMEFDYSQLELRILAYLAEDEKLIALLEGGADLHLYIARHALFSEVDPDLSDDEWRAKHKDLRDKAKVFNFGLGYGMTDFSVAQRFGCSVEEARSRIASYMALFPKLGRYFSRTQAGIKRRGYRENCYGRRRHFHGVKTMRHFGGYRRQLSHIMRQGYNFPVQSSGSDIHSRATNRLEVDEVLIALKAAIVMSVHDSVAMEVPMGSAEEVARHGQEIMETLPAEELSWKLPVEVNWGPRWGDWTHKLEADGTLQVLKEAA